MLFAASKSIASSDSPTPVLKLRFHLVQDLEMQQKGVDMVNWITPEMIRDTVMPDLNKIWSDAEIRWELAGVHNASTKSAGRQETVDYLLRARRNEQGKSDPERIKKLKNILPLAARDPNIINIYVIPYLGITSQGNASPRQNIVIMGQWSDKSSRGQSPPQKCILSQNGAPKKGSFSRTTAHELGHILGLRHPKKSNKTRSQNLLMGGGSSVPGVNLTNAEILIAREGAFLLEYAQR